MNTRVVARVVTASVILGLAVGCIGTRRATDRTMVKGGEPAMPQATGRITIKGGEPAIAAVLAFAEGPEFRSEVTKQNPMAEKTKLGLRRHRNTSVLDVTASASDPTAAKAVAESMLRLLKQKFPGPGEPTVEILENVKVVGQ